MTLDIDTIKEEHELLTLAKNSHAGGRLKALQELHKRQSLHAKYIARERLEDKSSKVRWLAFQILCLEGTVSQGEAAAFLRKNPLKKQQIFEALLYGPEIDNQKVGIQLIQKLNNPAYAKVLLSFIQDNEADAELCQVAADTVVDIDEEEAENVAIALLTHNDTDCIKKAAELIGRYGDKSWAKHLLPPWFEGETEKSASEALAMLFPEDREVLIKAKFTPVKLKLLQLFRLQECPTILFEMISNPSSGDIRTSALNATGDFSTQAIDQALDQAINSDTASTRAAALKTVYELELSRWLERATDMLEDHSGDVRSMALSVVSVLDPTLGVEKAYEALNDNEWWVVEKALDILRFVPSGKGTLSGTKREFVISTLIKWQTDKNSPAIAVYAAPRFLADWDDPRVMAALVNALNEDYGRYHSEPLLRQTGANKLPVLKNYPRRHWGPEPWKILQKQCNDLTEWARTTGEELLGVPVNLEWYYEGVGETRARQTDVNEISIRATNLPIFTETGTNIYQDQSHGEEIVKGIILHEIGHHLYDDGEKGHWTVRGQARAEGLEQIYAILRDERLERRLASRQQKWSRYFDRLAAYCFSRGKDKIPLSIVADYLKVEQEEVHRRFLAGELTGDIIEDPESSGSLWIEISYSFLLTIPGALPPLYAFLLGLRAGLHIDKEVHPEVAEALSRIPGNFKDLTHSELLKLCRIIGDLIGREDDHRRSMRELQKLMKKFRKLFSMLQSTLGLLKGLSKSFAELEKQITQATSAKNCAEESSSEERDAQKLTRKDASSRESSKTGQRRFSNKTGNPKVRSPKPADKGRFKNLGESCQFDRLLKEESLQPNPQGRAELVKTLRPHIRKLRPYLERLGIQTKEQYASRRGRRIDIAQVRQAAFRPTPNLLVFSEETQQADAYLGIIIDKSSSMGLERMKHAKLFATLLAESARGIRGLTGHISAFDSDTFYHLGNFQRHAISSLVASGSNNDAGGLLRAAELAVKSRKKNKLIIMISDGSPAACTFESLKKLVEELTRHGFLCAQVAVAPISEVAFPHFVDFSQMDTEEAVTQFGRLLRRLTSQWY